MPALHALDPHQDLGHYGYQSWQVDSGLPQNTVHAVAQTHDGYMWFATEGGLVRFDSIQFRVITSSTTPALKSDVVYSLTEDKTGSLWVGTSRGVVRYRDRHFEAVSGIEHAAWSIFADSRNRVWALSSDGLKRLDGNRFVDVQGAQGLSEDSTLLEGRDGSIWIGTPSGLAVSREGKSFQPVSTQAGIQGLAQEPNGGVWAGTRNGLESCSVTGCNAFVLPDRPSAPPDVTALAQSPDGALWIGTSSGLLRFDGRHTQQFSTGDGLPSDAVQILRVDREGTLWIGTNAGLARFAEGRIESFTPKEGLSSNQLLAISEDREGNLWLGTESGGVDILRDRAFSTYTVQDGISDDYIRVIYQDSKGTVWLGTNGGGLNRFDGRRFTAMTTADGLSSNIILSITSGPGGDLWVGTPDGLNQLHQGKVKVYTSADGLADDFVRSLSFDHSGALWIGTRRGLSRLEEGQFTSYSSLDGLGSDLVGALLEAHDGSLWAGTLGGLTHIEHGKFHNYAMTDGLSNNVITALHEDPDGTLWIGTNGGSLNRLRNGRFATIAKDNPLPPSIYSILDGGRGDLWMSSNHGIFRVNKDDLNHVFDRPRTPLSVSSYGTDDGMRVTEAGSGGHPAAWRLQDGSLWFATLKGASTVNPAHLPSNTIPPLAAIEGFSVDDRELRLEQSPGGQIEVPAGGRRFVINYAGLSFVAPQKVRFRYRLDGFDHQWMDGSSLRTAYYTNLPPGRYIFHVMVANNDGVWSAVPASVSFRLKPYFYQTLWFYFAVGLGVVLLGVAGYRWRVRHVESRFNAVLAERNRIAREIHDTLAQGFVAVSVQLQIVGRLLGSSTEAAQTHLSQAQELVKSGLEDARRAIWELRSQGPAEQDLATRLKQVAERVTAGSSIRSTVEARGTYHPLNERVESELLRIAQEAVTNVVRHAQAGHVRIRLDYETNRTRMAVEDDGVGFREDAPSAIDGHFGITGMKERARNLGGELSVTGGNGGGTRVTVELPGAE
ncbi:sensor histidine kinase [Silvibacterium acidisoli]|uniref:sensor histidine kinase n=1 Tax=Acidobacteriaceae bacterium ZG23-2 TaxID=2883246 RepID=UPI00406D26A8